MPRTGLSPEEIRTRAVEITLDGMRISGFEKLRLSDVAKALGISHAALYAHFSNKAELFDAVVRAWLEEIEIELVQVSDDALPPHERILAWFETLYRLKRDRVRTDPQVYYAFGRAITHATPAALFHVQTLLAQLERLIVQADFAGDASETASLLFEATAAFHYPTLVDKNAEVDRSSRLRTILLALLKGWSLADDN